MQYGDDRDVQLKRGVFECESCNTWCLQRNEFQQRLSIVKKSYGHTCLAIIIIKASLFLFFIFDDKSPITISRTFQNCIWFESFLLHTYGHSCENFCVRFISLLCLMYIWSNFAFCNSILNIKWNCIQSNIEERNKRIRNFSYLVKLSAKIKYNFLCFQNISVSNWKIQN